MFNIKKKGLVVGLFLVVGVMTGGWLVSILTVDNIEDSFHGKFSSELLAHPLSIQGTKSMVKNGTILKSGSLVGKDVIMLTYDLQGVCLLGGPASEIALVARDGQKYTVSLADYTNNCSSGDQTTTIPLRDFVITQPLENMESLTTQFWYPTPFAFGIAKITAYPSVLGYVHQSESYAASVLLATRETTRVSRYSPKLSVRSKPSPKPSPKPPTATTTAPIATSTTPIATTTTPIATTTPAVPPPPTSTSTSAWSIRSVSSMKETKDKICNQDPADMINSWINKAVGLGVNYIAVETPYDDPSCGSSVTYTKAWVDAIHAKGLNVWHRHMPLAFEGIYSTPKDAGKDYLAQISNYIKAHPSFFKAGDIFSPIPEPQNGGIAGVTYCPQNICLFANAAAFNKWLRDAITTSESAFASIGLGGKMKIGYYGFDGFVAWGDNNPDWEGILENATITAMGNITIDHYPELVGDTMENDLNELQAKYPNTPIVIGEWGTVTSSGSIDQVKNSMGASQRKNVIGFNYWHMGMGGNESILNDNMTNKANYDTVKSFFIK